MIIKLFNTSTPLHYSLAFSPLYFTGIDIGLAKKIGPFYGKFSYDNGSSFTESLINVINQAGNTQFFFQTQYSCIPQKAESKLKMFKEFQFKLHQNEINGLSLQYLPQDDSFLYSGVYTYNNYAAGIHGSHLLTVNERGIKFSAKPKLLSILARADFNQLLFNVSMETKLLPCLGFSFRLEKLIPSLNFTTKIAAVTDLQSSEDGDFSVAFQAGGSVTHKQWGTLFLKADTSGNFVIALNPSIFNKLHTKSTISIKPTRTSYRTSYSFNMTLMNIENNVDRPFLETLVDYMHALVPSLDAGVQGFLARFRQAPKKQ